MEAQSQFKITAYLTSPIAIQNTYLTLDAILFGILQERSSDIDTIFDDIPIKRRDGLYFSSKIYVQNPIILNHSKIGGIQFQKDQTYLEKNHEPNFKSLIDNKRGKFKSILSRYNLASCESAFWLAQGDGDRIKSLLDRSTAIGALRKEGFGLVRRFEIEEISNVHVLIDEGGAVRRPIPIRLGGLCGSVPVSPTAMETWRPPYWDQSGIEECYAPSSKGLIFD